jgi:hypothetical protein
MKAVRVNRVHKDRHAAPCSMLECLRGAKVIYSNDPSSMPIDETENGIKEPANHGNSSPAISGVGSRIAGSMLVENNWEPMPAEQKRQHALG